jgi:hypothetical protein
MLVIQSLPQIEGMSPQEQKEQEEDLSKLSTHLARTSPQRVAQDADGNRLVETESWNLKLAVHRQLPNELQLRSGENCSSVLSASAMQDLAMRAASDNPEAITPAGRMINPDKCHNSTLPCVE